MYYNDNKMKMKQNKIKLQAIEFEDLPPTHLSNLPDFELFSDYLQADMTIEVSRALKYHLMPFVLDRVESDGENRAENLEFLQDYCKNEFLKIDEFIIYQGLIEGLNMD